MIRFWMLQHVQQNAFPGEKGQWKFKGAPDLPYFTFIKLLTVLSKDFSFTPFACPLGPLFSKAGTPTFGIQTNSSHKYEQGRVT